MSSKASEILGVSAKHPRGSHRRGIASRDGASLFSSRTSQLQRDAGESIASDTANRAPPSRSSRTSSRALKREKTSYSIESASKSTGFGDNSLSSRSSALALRSIHDPEPASRGIESTRTAPSAWRGLTSRAGGSSMSIGSRTSRESMGTVRNHITKPEPPSRNKTLLKSALSRLSLRPSKSKSSLTSARDPHAQSGLSTAVTTASTTRQATPRPSSPNRPTIPQAAVSTRESSLGRGPASGKPKRRQNSRMPTEVERLPTRNWFDDLEDIDFDDAKPPSQITIVGFEDSLSSPNGVSTVTTKKVRHFSKPLQSTSQSPISSGTQQRDVPTPVTSLSNVGNLSGSVTPQNISPAKRRSKAPETKPHDYSILNLSDSDDDRRVPVIQPPRLVRTELHVKKPSKETAILRHPPSRLSKAQQSSSAVVFTLKKDEDLAETSPSLPSLIESGSSRQASFISSGSFGRGANSELGPGNGTTPLKSKSFAEVSGTLYSNSANSFDHVQTTGLGPDDEALEGEQTRKRDFGPLTGTDQIMTALSPEEVAWLAHMRRNRAETLRRLSPTSVDAEGPSLEHMQEVDNGEIKEDDVQNDDLGATNGGSPEPLRDDRTGEKSKALESDILDDEPFVMDTLITATQPGSKSEGEEIDPWASEATVLEVASASEEARVPASSGTVTLVENFQSVEGHLLIQEPTTDLTQSDAASSEETPAAPGSFEILKSVGPEQPNLESNETPDDAHTEETMEQAEQDATDRPEAIAQETSTGLRQMNVGQSEARSKLDKQSGRSSLPVPKRIQINPDELTTLRSPSEPRSQSPRIPVLIGKKRQSQTILHPSALSHDSSTSVQEQYQEPPTPKLPSSLQRSGATESPSVELTTEAPVILHRHLSRQTRRDTGARDVLEAWQALGGA